MEYYNNVIGFTWNHCFETKFDVFDDIMQINAAVLLQGALSITLFFTLFFYNLNSLEAYSLKYSEINFF